MKQRKAILSLCLAVLTAYACSNEELVDQQPSSTPASTSFNLEDHPELIIAEYESPDHDVNVKFIEPVAGQVAVGFTFSQDVSPEKINQFQSALDEIEAGEKSFEDLYRELSTDRADAPTVGALRSATERYKTHKEKIASGKVKIELPSEAQFRALANSNPSDDRTDANSRTSCSPNTAMATYFVNELCNLNSYSNQYYTVPSGAYTKVCVVHQSVATDVSGPIIPKATDFYRVWATSADNNQSAVLQVTFFNGTIPSSFHVTLLPHHYTMYHYFGIGVRASKAYTFNGCNVNYTVSERRW